MNYITGSGGYIGGKIFNQISATRIPHEAIDTIELMPFDSFFFCSAYGNMSDQTDDEMIIKANVLDLITILNQAVKFKFKSFVYLSTSSVKLPIQTTYSRSKKAAEEILMAYIEKYHLPITIIRPFSVCGVGEQEKHLIPTLLRAAIEDKPVNLCPGTHDFVDIDDLVAGILNLSDYQAQGVYEIGTGIKTTNEEVLALVEKVTGKKLNVTYVPSLRKYDTPNWVCTNFKARGYGWLPKKTLEQSITEAYIRMIAESNTREFFNLDIELNINTPLLDRLKK